VPLALLPVASSVPSSLSHPKYLQYSLELIDRQLLCEHISWLFLPWYMYYFQPSCLYYIVSNEVALNVDMFRFRMKFIIVNQVYNTLIIAEKRRWRIV
jgi:hypothetical protein